MLRRTATGKRGHRAHSCPPRKGVNCQNLSPRFAWVLHLDMKHDDVQKLNEFHMLEIALGVNVALIETLWLRLLVT